MTRGILSIAFRILTVVAAMVWAGMAYADKRVALVIGNSQYRSINQLRTPANDAPDIAKALQNIGFDVTLKTDVTIGDLPNILADFARKSQGADTTLFYYAGHGIQYQGKNYILPVDITVQDADDIEFKAISQDRVLDAMRRAGGGVKIEILDACRDNPLAQQTATRSLSGGGGSETRGLARIDRTDGIVTVYSAEPGMTALDGSGRNSPFAKALLDNVQQPGVEIKTMFQRIARQVYDSTGGQQRPEIDNGLLDDYYLSPGEDDSNAWDRVQDSENPADFAQFIQRFPNSTHRREAERFQKVFEGIRQKTLADQAARDQAAKGAQAQAAAVAQEQAAATKAAQEQAARDQVAAAKVAQEQAAATKAAQEQAARDQVAAAKVAQEQAAAAKAAQEQAARDQAAAAKVAQEQVAAAKVAQQQATAAKAAQEQAARDQAAAAAGKVAQEQAAATKAAQEQAARDQAAAATKVAQEQAAATKAAQEQAARDQAAATAAKVAQEQAAAAKAAQDQAAQAAQQSAVTLAQAQPPAVQPVSPAPQQMASLESGPSDRQGLACVNETAAFNAIDPTALDAREKLKKLSGKLECVSLRSQVNDVLAAIDTRAKAVQTALKDMGCYAGPVDGSLDNATQKAIGRYLSLQGAQTADLHVTDDLVGELQSQPAPSCGIVKPAAPVAEVPSKKKRIVELPKREREEPVARPVPHVRTAERPAPRPEAPPRAAASRPLPPAPPVEAKRSNGVGFMGGVGF